MKILIVDDERPARLAMRRALGKLEQDDVFEVSNAREGIEHIGRGEADLVFLDIQMPGMDGMSALEEINRMPRHPLVVMCTAFGSERVAVDAIKRGAYDYISKPYDIEDVRLLVSRAREKISLIKENTRLKEELTRISGSTELIGTSEKWRWILDRIRKVSRTEVTVLISGESGTGKELAARAIHDSSSRCDKPFIVFDCSNVDKELIRSELFGHERGSFTGAESARSGAFEQANSGTIFIDEVGELDANLQPRLLRVLETQQVIRLGSDSPRQVDVRVIAATNRNLLEMVKEGSFREDLYHRLGVVNIHLPALRERRDDLPLLISHFLHLASEKFGRKFTGITGEARRQLLDSAWPGNVRQLKNAIESAAVLAEGDVLQPSDFSNLECGVSSQTPAFFAPIDMELPFQESKRRIVEEFERRYLAHKLNECEGNISHAAREIGMHRQSLQQKLKSLDIKATDSGD